MKELDVFELRGKMLLMNLTCSTMLCKIDYLNVWDDRKLRIINTAWQVGDIQSQCITYGNLHEVGVCHCVT